MEKIPDELITNYKTQTRKGSPIIEHLKIAAALKLWNNRGYRDVRFDVPLVFGGKTVFVKVLAKHADGVVVGIECASVVKLCWLRERLALLKACLPSDSYLIVVFPETAGKRVDKATKLADEVGVTNKNGKVKQMIFTTSFYKE
ncbi:MAG: hypothetical protein ACFCUE_14895 [Candidatus Bathyarchaeia archaeon]